MSVETSIDAIFLEKKTKERRPRSRLLMILVAFLAILRRDLVVTGREFIPFLIQVLLQPLFFLFIFGKVLPSIGAAQQSYASLLLPGIVGLTVVTTALQGVTLPLVLDLGFGREIDDRLLAPLPVSLVALEKILFAALCGLVAGAIIFPLAYWVLGSSYSVRADAIGIIIGIMVLTALAGATLGLTIGTLVKPEQIGLMFALIFTPLIFTGCTYYPWSQLDGIRWFQVIALFNPLTYACEGLRYAMVPPIHGYTLPTLEIGWVLLGLGVTFVAFLFLGIYTFRRAVVS
ncbi:ABC transporter permease [Thermogemmatispora onikobensis]|uniref:ABC transporter permease n=1 Tax=Thermogemmatispora onikobensis TaxID=732234 RepID=UPI00114CA674|nr:ABC transporter permease [Thermogemmatispora onikobensis]